MEHKESGAESAHSSDAGREVLAGEGYISSDLTDYLVGAFPRAPFAPERIPDTCAVLAPIMEKLPSLDLRESVFSAIAEDSVGQLEFKRKNNPAQTTSDLELISNGKVIYSEKWNPTINSNLETTCQTDEGRIRKTWSFDVPNDHK